MQIGVIGAGTTAQAFARIAVAAGHRVVFSNSRGPGSLAPLIARFGPQASAAPTTVAVDNPLVLLAVPWPTVEAALSGLPKWQGQLLVDPTNGFNDGTPAGGLADFDGGSSSEHVASLAPGARVVKAMNAVFMNKSATGPTEGGFRRAVFVSGHDDDARRVVADLFESFGFAPVDPGPLKVGERIQGVGGPIEGHDFFLPWPEQRAYPTFNGDKTGRSI